MTARIIRLTLATGAVHLAFFREDPAKAFINVQSKWLKAGWDNNYLIHVVDAT